MTRVAARREERFDLSEVVHSRRAGLPNRPTCPEAIPRVGTTLGSSEGRRPTRVRRTRDRGAVSPAERLGADRGPSPFEGCSSSRPSTGAAPGCDRSPRGARCAWSHAPKKS
jgi:hypothetical protein